MTIGDDSYENFEHDHLDENYINSICQIVTWMNLRKKRDVDTDQDQNKTIPLDVEMRCDTILTGDQENCGRYGLRYCCHPADFVPIDANWSQWTKWGKCSHSCGGGGQTRTRTCQTSEVGASDPLCHGKSEDVRRCNLEDCGKY